ncbi:MAG TPA: mechanosensitive ion channel domain-containing protein [Gammaproteobacteria bacterium]
MRTILVNALLLAAFVAAAPPVSAQPPPEQAEDVQADPDAEVETLIRVLEDDEARARLIERLRAAAEEQAAAAPAETLADRFALYTREAAEGVVAVFVAVGDVARHVYDVLTGAADVDLAALRDAVLGVALLVAATFATFLLLQVAFRIVQRRLAAGAAAGDALVRAKQIGVSAVLDLATVLVAWGAGYAFAIGIGEARRVGVDQSLFLNAFLAIELVKAVARAVLAPQWPALRPVRADDTSAAYWYFWLSRLVSLLGYTFLFAAPLLARGVSTEVAEAVRIVVLLAALAVAVAIVLQNRDDVRARLMRRAAEARSHTVGRSLAMVGRVWHIVAIVYLVGVFGLSVSRPGTALPFVLAATGQSVLAVVVGAVLVAFVSRVASGGMRLPRDVKERLPLLEARLNAFVPNVLRVVRLVVTVGVIVTIVQAWGIADVGAWLASDTGRHVVATAVSVTLVLLGGAVFYLAVQSWIEYRLSPNSGAVMTSRERTLLSLFRNAFTIALAVLVFMLVLSELGVNIGPLLAGAGVVGLAVGFGAQKLVQDVINGVFIQLENTMNEGDVVTAGGMTGVVERLTIRSVALRALDGTYHVIPFSSVDTVSNLTKHFSQHVAAVRVAYKERIPEVKEAMLEAFERLRSGPLGAHVLESFEMHGVVDLAESAVVVRGRIKTVAGKQWEVGRAYNELLKEVFDERNIEIPFPHRRLYFSAHKPGHEQPPPGGVADRAPAEDAPPERAALQRT